MEQNEEYINLLSVLNELHSQLRNEYTLFENMRREAEETKKQIENHFNACMQALMERKEGLIFEVESKFTEKAKILQGNQIKLYKAIEGCQEIKQTGENISCTSMGAAVAVWRGAQKLANPILREISISVLLPLSLIMAISQHGLVFCDDPFEKSLSMPSLEHVNQQHERNERNDANNTKIEKIFETHESTETEKIEEIGKSEEIEKPGKTERTADTENSRRNFHPCGIYMNQKDKSIYFCDISNSAVRKVNMQGTVDSVTKKGEHKFKWPHGITMNVKENTFFVTNSLAHTVNKILPSGEVQIFAGNGMAGNRDGPGQHASFNDPTGITVDPHTGFLYVSDRGNHMIRMIAPDGDVATLAGTGKRGYANGHVAQFNSPWGIAFDDFDFTLLVCDCDNNKLRKISLSGEVSTFCDVEKPSFVTIAANRTILVSSFATNRVTIITKKDGRYFGSILDGSRGEPPNSGFFTPMGIAFDDATNSCFVADWGSSKICRYILNV